MRIGIYPGSFDPLTYGHMDIIERALKVCDKLVVGILLNSSKNNLFSLDERVEILRHCCREYENVEVMSFGGLLTDYCKKHKINCIIRGLSVITSYSIHYTKLYDERHYFYIFIFTTTVP